MDSFQNTIKQIDSEHIVVDINDYNDINEIISLNEQLNQKIFVLNDLITARLHYYDIVLIKKNYLSSIELYLFLFNKKLTGSDLSIYNSMRTFSENSMC
jgi:hypothetical protein